MPNAAEAERWLWPAVCFVAGVTLCRVVLLAFNQTDLFVDEAQYWFWGQTIEWGYYSKPPLIGWVIRASTEIGGDTEFWVRLPACLFHAATALILAAIAADLSGRRAAVFTAAAYITLPMVTVGSFLISTDTIMFPFLALALLAWLRAGAGAIWWALLAGGALGLAMLSKYAAVYGLLGAALGAAFVPALRPGWRAAGGAALAFAIVMAPHVIWNITTGAPTVEHTLDNADWVRDPGSRASLDLASLAEFFFSQFAVFGPVFFGVLIWLTLAHRNRLLWFSIPAVLVVCAQALLSHAYANWAAAAFLAGTVVVVPWLLNHAPRWLWGSLVLHGLLALLIPLGAVFPEPPRAIYDRYLDLDARSHQILADARSIDAAVIVARNRDVLANLFWVRGDGDPEIRSVPPKGRARNHYALNHPYDGTPEGPILYVDPRRPPSGCAVEPLPPWPPEIRRTALTWRVTPPCW